MVGSVPLPPRSLFPAPTHTAHAFRQWPGNAADLDFRGVISRCNAVVVVVEAIERVGELEFSKAVSGVKALQAHERRMLPFIRVW